MNPNTEFDEDGITVDAHAALDRYSNEWRRDLLLRASLYSDSRGASKITAGDVFNAAVTLRREDIGAGDTKSGFGVRVSLLAFGALLLVGVVIYAYTYSDSTEISAAVAAIIGAATGVAGTLVSSLLTMRAISMQRRRPPMPPEQRRRMAVGELLSQWQAIERMLSSGLKGSEQQEYTRRGLSSIVRHLLNSGRIDEDQHLLIKEILRARNTVVHGRKELTLDELSRTLDQAITVKEQLRQAGFTEKPDEK